MSILQRIINFFYTDNKMPTTNKYYYPYYLHWRNLWSFKHYNSLNNYNPQEKMLALWSITRSQRFYRQEYIAFYNFYTQNYEFLGQRYLLYDEIVNRALQLK